MIEPLLKVRGIKKYFPITAGLWRREVGRICAVDGVDFTIYPGQVVGLVGESGSGKSTVARTAIRLLEPTEGTIFYRGRNLLEVRRKELSSLRREIQMIFQHPTSSLNPRQTIGEAIGEPLLYHGLVKNSKECEEAVAEVLRQVGLGGKAMYRYPHSFSGGQQQRICIGRAIALHPKLLLCDEPLAGLDVSIQAQILILLEQLKEELNLSFLFISHDLPTVRYFCDEVIVLYLGQVMESAPTEALFHHPRHPYTQALLDSMPREHPREPRKQTPPPGEATRYSSGPGCPFRERCPHARAACDSPVMEKRLDNGHSYRCIL